MICKTLVFYDYIDGNRKNLPAVEIELTKWLNDGWEIVSINMELPKIVVFLQK